MTRDLDLCVITETWLKWDDEMAYKSIPPNGYNNILYPRIDGRNGGGIELIYIEFLKVNEEREMQNNQTLEYSRFKIELNSHNTVNLYAIYRNPALSVMLMGYLNIHIDNPSHADTNTFNDFLDSFNLQNHINFPTHIA